MLRQRMSIIFFQFSTLDLFCSNDKSAAACITGKRVKNKMIVKSFRNMIDIPAQSSLSQSRDAEVQRVHPTFKHYILLNQ